MESNEGKLPEGFTSQLERIAWLLGAIESQSEIIMCLLAQQQGVELVWWDPTDGPPPSEGKQHGAPANLKKIYRYLPVKLRKNRTPHG